MDKGMGRNAGTDHVATGASSVRPLPNPNMQSELEGVMRNGVVELTSGKLPEGTRVQVRPRN